MSQSQKRIASTRKRIEGRIALAYKTLQTLQELCTHPNADKKYGSNTGNYDPSADCYWIDWVCPDCGKKWTTPQ